LASGNGIGLVLSGGGARGFAHIGVYRALIEAGVPIDAVGGCSIGAPLAGGIARHIALDDMNVEVQRLFHRLLDYTFPAVSLVKGARITKSIEESFGGWDIEDLWLPYYCVSTNLTQSQLEVHRRGDLVRAVRASVAIPGILPPVPMNGDLLVDGGVLNNLPFEPMRNDGRIDTVIAVDVAPERGPRAKADFGLSVSGTSAVIAALRRAPSDYPSAPAVLLRSMLAGSVNTQKVSLRGDAVDLLVRLDLPGVGLLDFERVDEIAAAGYRSAVDQVASWAATRPWTGPLA
jgi:predicted acylesterase/phospholipase RssA